MDLPLRDSLYGFACSILSERCSLEKEWMDTIVFEETILPTPNDSTNDENSTNTDTRVSGNSYSDKSEQITKFLTTLRRPLGMSRSQFSVFFFF